MIGLPRAYDIGPGCIRADRDLAECTADIGITYLIVTTQDEKFLRYRFGVDGDTVAYAISRMIANHGFEIMYDRGHVQVLKRTDAPAVRLEPSL